MSQPEHIPLSKLPSDEAGIRSYLQGRFTDEKIASIIKAIERQKRKFGGIAGWSISRKGNLFYGGPAKVRPYPLEVDVRPRTVQDAELSAAVHRSMEAANKIAEMCKRNPNLDNKPTFFAMIHLRDQLLQSMDRVGELLERKPGDYQRTLQALEDQE